MLTTSVATDSAMPVLEPTPEVCLVVLSYKDATLSKSMLMWCKSAVNLAFATFRMCSNACVTFFPRAVLGWRTQ